MLKVLRYYAETRSKSHGVKPSRRLSLALALSKYGLESRSTRVLYCLYFSMPDWMKLSRSERFCGDG